MPKRNTALITGASSGIGFEFARLFAKDGYHLVLVARNKAKLEQIATELQKEYGVTTHVFSQDLSFPEAPQAVFDFCQEQHIQVDVLVNNAGYGLSGLFSDIDLQKEMNMIDLNVKALTALTKLFLPGMIQKKQGKILNVASTAAFQPGPTMAVYFATKAYVLHFSEAIAEELRDTGVTVTALCPGPTVTGFQERAHMSGVKDRPTLTAASVAKAGYDALFTGKPVVIPGFQNTLFAFASRLASRKMATRITGKLMRRMIG